MNSKLRLATKGVRGLHPYQPGKPISEIEREYGVRAAIKLASNENPLGPSAHASEAAAEALGELSRYPDGNGFALKQALSKRLQVGAEQITLGNGSNDVLDLVARTFASGRQEVIYSEYAFAVYPIVTQAAGATAVVTGVRDWGHDLAAMREAVSKRTSLVFIANPNNPTGTWLDAGTLEDFLRSLREDVIVVVDEAYFEYVEHAEYADCIPWIERYPNLIVTRTFSKAYGLAALRVGYAVSHPDIAELLNRVRQPFNVNSVALAAARAALLDEEHLARSVQVNRHGMKQLVAGFERMGLDYIPSAGNFVAVDVGASAAAVYEDLLRHGVIVRPVASYAMPKHLRVTVGLERENRRFLTALEKILNRDAK